MKSPKHHPIIKKVMRFARRKSGYRFPGLKHSFCRVCDEAHEKDPRLYSHSFCKRDTICWARAMGELPPEVLAGICLHELGHQIVGPMPEADDFDAEKAADLAVFHNMGVEIDYVTPELIQYVDMELLK